MSNVTMLIGKLICNRFILDYDEDSGLHFDCTASLLLQHDMEVYT